MKAKELYRREFFCKAPFLFMIPGSPFTLKQALITGKRVNYPSKKEEDEFGKDITQYDDLLRRKRP
jgi:hypothetical protein